MTTNLLTLTGTNLSTSTVITVDGVAAPVLSAAPNGTSLIVRVPAHAAGAVTLTATNSGTTSATGGLTYVTPNPAPPTRPPGTPNAATPRPQPMPPRLVPTTAVPPVGATPTNTPRPAPVRRGGP